ncbi:MAG: hypothetical protein IMW85_00425 [Thermicanus sp.]|nr:hypothetical protein [Thermicanus sp.]
MLKRIATEYKRVSLWLEEEELQELVELLHGEEIRLHEQVLENGDLEFMLCRGADEIRLLLEKKEGKYHLSSSCVVRDRTLTDVMRKVTAHFKGEALVYRLYPTFKVEYQYERGQVLAIREIADGNEKLIFENRDFSFILERIMENKAVEQEIAEVRGRVDHLLDERNRVNPLQEPDQIVAIDNQLSLSSKRLFELEA